MRLANRYQKKIDELTEEERDYEEEIRFWYLETYKLSPLDPKYYELPFEFLEYSWFRYFETASYDKTRDALIRKKFKEEQNKKQEESIKKGLEEHSGFDEQQMTKVLEEIRNMQN